MKKNYSILFLLILFAIINGISTSAYGVEKINPYLQSVMQNANDNELIPVYITFNENLSLSDFDDISYDTPKLLRRQIVIDRLRNFANQKQSRVNSYLHSQTSSRILYSEQLWIVNVIVLKAVPSVITSLASDYNEIKQINYDPAFPIEQLIDFSSIAAPYMPLAPEPGIILMNADDVWALGNKGKGVLVANADDGFWWRHPDLVKGMWQNLGEDANNNGMTIIWGSGTSSTFDAGDINGVDNDGNGKIDDFIGWDYGTNSYNITTSSHGSATLGHVIGDGTGGTQTGVSPEAKCMVMRNSGINLTNLLGSFQYATLMGADVITSSLSYKWYFNPKPDYSLFRQTSDMTLAAGVIHSNSTSNDGNSVGIPLNISAAGCNPAPWRHPDQLKVGNLSGVIGVGNVNCLSDVISSSSPYGPFTWGNWALWNNGTWPYTILPQHMDYPYSRVAPIEIPDSMGLKKPDVSAPGESSISTYVSSGTGYGTFGGTSSATPHTAGCLALMLSINPEMLPRDIDRVLELTAIEKGDPGKDYRYGAGRIDALAATTSPAVLTEGVNGGSNWLLGNTTPVNDTAKELVGLKLRNTASPWIGSIRKLVFYAAGTATGNDAEKYRLFFDVNKNNVVDAGDILLREIPFTLGSAIFDSVKFKVTDTVRHIILAIKTKPTATATNTVNLGMPNNTHVSSYYTVNAQSTNFPYGSVTTGIGNTENPLVFSLRQNFPNPFNPTTIINYSLAKKSHVVVRVYDAIGRELAVLLNNTRDPGNYQIEFDANFYKGLTLSSGVYFYKLEAFSPETNSLLFNDIKKMVLVK
ncbi:MAG TPA: S8 family serine peptidase [Ignavibacteria bacterium]|nr:S8 family serine peptidase [Ignavibacteria bacterium]